MGKPIPFKRFLLLCGLFLTAVAFEAYLFSIRQSVAVLETNLHKLPYVIEGWQGEDFAFQDYVYQALNADENLNRKYTSPDGRFLWLYIGYYGTQKGGHPQHVPQGCYPGSGWGIESVRPFQMTVDGTEVTVNNLFAKKGNQTEQTLYWLQNAFGTIMHTGLKQNLEKLRTRLFYNRCDGAFVRISSPVFNEDRDATLAYQKTFAQALIPLLSGCWPVEASHVKQ